jgi:hypothetical protein
MNKKVKYTVHNFLQRLQDLSVNTRIWILVRFQGPGMRI